MRKLRGLYMTLVYILAAPFMTLLAAMMVLMNINHPVKAVKACYEGLKLGHKSAIEWVKN